MCNVHGGNPEQEKDHYDDRKKDKDKNKDKDKERKKSRHPLIHMCKVGILYKKKTPPPPNPFSFLQPLSIEVIILASIVIINITNIITKINFVSNHIIVTIAIMIIMFINIVILIIMIIVMIIQVWIYTTTAYLALAITLFCLARISPYEWDDDGEGSATNVSIINIFIVFQCVCE